MAVGTISPRSLIASTSKVSGRLARVISGRVCAVMSKPSYGANLGMPASSAADVGHFDLALCRGIRGADLGIAVIACAPHGGDRGAYLHIRFAPAQQGAKVVARSREQTGVEHAFGGDAGAGAGAAERLGHRRDHADFARAVAVAPAL